MFVVVVQAGSLSAAAVRLGVPLTTLSRRIRDLERQLNVQLLERSARGTKLTHAGTKLYEHASLGIEALREAEQAVINDQAQLNGRLRLSLPQSLEPWWDLLAAFQRRYPGVEISIHSTERRMDLIEDGIDVAVRVGTIVHETMVARRLMSWRHILVASPALIERYGMPAQPDTLHQFPCAAWASRIDDVARWKLGSHTVAPKMMLRVNDYQHLCHWALDGHVITELPPFLAAPHIKAKRLLPLLTQHPLPEVDINLLYPSHRHPSAIVLAYLDFCRIYLPNILRSCDIDSAC
ncbi:bacterial regulatory helix-turn-helix, lysR family protein [Janthinobacterium agaricidamnosum NBRC 102515 = DSM 9628]|uniref:Bacterial regulatory helix-turn-helix, lysR family protein n=2 Tax=Janthinobacterium agaricidamnosum TaxID=55508 RepID=W0V843_9BURK|nr:bacterial regulatory helix-turn-helix, lysR family protein [Janthinobacterium agaricidamnosum NBRC 102515 = DSM 9628]